MKLKIIACITSIAFINSFVSAREFRTPIPLLKYMLHTDPLIPSEEKSQFYAWAGYYQRKCDTARNVGGTETKSSPLSALFFNQANFPVNDIFATQNVSPTNILFSTELSPRFNYTDRGAVIGIVSSHAVRSNVVLGGRVTIPFRSFKMDLTQGPIVNNRIGPEVLAQFVREQVEIINGVPVNTFAYRLDFLSQLPSSWTGPGASVKLVDYVNTQFVGNPPESPVTFPITIANIDVTNNFNTLDMENQNPVTVVKRSDGSAPMPPFAQELNQAQGFNDLPGSGTPVPNNGRRRFVITESYAPLGANRALQGTFWDEPSYTTVPTPHLVEPAQEIQARVDLLIGTAPGGGGALTGGPAATINMFFEGAGINFNSQKRSGLGDIDTQFFTQYWWNNCSFIEGNVALRLPTAGTQMAPGQIALQSLGNNGHPEIMFGARGYWNDYNWLLLQADALYSVVLKRTEIVATPFEGATIKNIGSGIPAHVNWQYFVGHLEGTVFRNFTPRDYGLIRFGYEAYVKTKDRISLQTPATCTCIPTGTQAVNGNNLTRNTHVTAHKLYSEVCMRHEFNRVTAGIFASVGGVVGGTNTPKDTDWYVGLEFFL